MIRWAMSIRLKNGQFYCNALDVVDGICEIIMRRFVILMRSLLVYSRTFQY